jgi:predicted peroxiredoxin
MELTALQTIIVAQCAEAELRTKEQMLSLLLAEGVRFYFCDSDARFTNLKDEDLVKQLELDAAKQAGYDYIPEYNITD